MARIQILQLPPSGPNGEQPFALIVDQCETPPQRVVVGPDYQPVELPDPWQDFGKQIGARSVLVTDETVEIVDGTAGGDDHLVEFDHAALAESFATALRFHLESPEASDAVRAYVDRQRLRGGQ